mgnify:CR=1 FL=1
MRQKSVSAVNVAHVIAKNVVTKEINSAKIL